MGQSHSVSAPKFSISIVTYTAVKQARRCIDSIRDSLVVNDLLGKVQLILTSNGNSKATEAFRIFAENTPEEFDTVLIVNEKNRGFIEPSNNALNLATGEYFVLLNDDCTVPINWLELLKEPFLADPKCAITGASGGCCTLDENFGGYRGDTIDYVEGSCFCIKRELALKHGLFDEELKMAYCEDADCSLRYRSLGYTIHLAEFALENHVSGTTASTVPGLSKHAQANFALCRKRWGRYLRTRRFK